MNLAGITSSSICIILHILCSFIFFLTPCHVSTQVYPLMKTILHFNPTWLSPSPQAATTLAKQLINLRKQKTKNMAVSSRVMAIGHQTQTMHSTAKMAGAMSTASKVKFKLFCFQWKDSCVFFFHPKFMCLLANQRSCDI